MIYKVQFYVEDSCVDKIQEIIEWRGQNIGVEDALPGMVGVGLMDYVDDVHKGLKVIHDAKTLRRLGDSAIDSGNGKGLATPEKT